MATTATVVIDGDDDIVTVDQDTATDNDVQHSDEIILVDLMDDDSESDSSEYSEEEKSNIDKIEDDKMKKVISGYNASRNAETNCSKQDNSKDEETDFVLLLKTNNLMNKVIQKCLSIAENKGMESIINKTLVPLYKNADINLKKSELFLDILKKVLSNLKHDPRHKFSHIKTLCEELKKSKKVPFVTLSTDINKPPQHRHSDRLRAKTTKKSKFCNLQEHTNQKKIRQIRRKTDVIDLDQSDEDKAIAVVDIDDSDDQSDEVVILDDKTDHEQSFACSNKENYNMDKDINKIRDPVDPPLERPDNTEKHRNEATYLEGHQLSNMEKNYRKCSEENQNVISINRSKDSNKINLLVSDKSVEDKNHSHISEDILVIERKIQFYKELVDDCEEREVTTNSDDSPYLQSDVYKSIIIELYKRLCQLTEGGDVTLVKQRMVRLHVSHGHPPGPVRRLERYLNSTVDETGFIPLPDFHDVFRCVQQSNIVDKLGWSKNEIMNEAMVLFTQCGSALRKNRQKREYKDLMRYVQDKSLDDNDPANEDPVLAARLEENKRLARTKENEVFERYANMEFMNHFNKSSHNNKHNITIEQANSDSDSEPDAKQSKTNTNCSTNSSQNNRNDNSTNFGVTQATTNFSMPVISQTCSISQIHSNRIQTTLNVTQHSTLSHSSSSNQMEHPVINQTIPNSVKPHPVPVLSQTIPKPRILNLVPVINQNNSFSGILYPVISQNTSNLLKPPLMFSMQSSSEEKSNTNPSFPIFTIVPVTGGPYSSHDSSISEPINNNQRTGNNVTISNEIEDNRSKVEVIENSFKKTVSKNNSSKRNLNFSKKLISKEVLQNNLNDNSMGQMEVIENSFDKIHRLRAINDNINTAQGYNRGQINNKHKSVGRQIVKQNIITPHVATKNYVNITQINNNTNIYKENQTKEPLGVHFNKLNEIHESNDDSVQNVNIAQNSIIVNPTQIGNNLNVRICDLRESIARTPYNRTDNIEETQITKELVDIQHNKLKENHDSHTDSTEKNNVNKTQTNEQLMDIQYNNSIERLETINGSIIKCINILKNSHGDLNLELIHVEEDPDKHNDNLDKCNEINKAQNTNHTVINEKIPNTEENKQIDINETIVGQQSQSDLNVDLIGTNVKTSICSNMCNIGDRPKIRVKPIAELQNKTQLTNFIDNVQTDDKVTVKSEAIEDIQRILDGLGDHYISTIFDIEDPFVVVEISSDSSSDDDL